MLTLEINTIVKDDMNATKMPASRRITFLELADEYRAKLDEYGVCKLAVPTITNMEAIPDDYFRWRFAGEYSFIELVSMSKKGEELYNVKIAAAPEAEKQKLKEAAKIMSRIQAQSSQIVGMFKHRRLEYAKEIEAKTPDFEALQVKEAEASSVDPETGLFLSQLGSKGWNNDISQKDCNKYDDMELNPDQIALIRKATEIGTQQILMQTVIQIDGDITTYLSTRFLQFDPTTRTMVNNLHNQSIGTATKFWADLFKAVANLAGKAFNEIFESKG